MNTPRNNYFSKSSQQGTSLQTERPSAMPHQYFTALTKEQRRNLPDPRDGFIDVEGHPKLTARYGQVNFKTPKHGKIHSLPVRVQMRIIPSYFLEKQGTICFIAGKLHP